MRRRSTHRPEPWGPYSDETIPFSDLPVADPVSQPLAQPAAPAPVRLAAETARLEQEIKGLEQTPSASDPSGRQYLAELDLIAPANNPWSWYPGCQELDPILASAPLQSRYGTLSSQGHIAIDRGGHRPAFVSFIVESRDKDLVDIRYRGHDLSLAVEHVNRALNSDDYRNRVVKRSDLQRLLSVEDFHQRFQARREEAVQQRWFDQLEQAAGW